MPKSKGREPALGEMQDFSGRYRGAQQVEARAGGWYEFADIGDELVGEYRGTQPFRNGMKSTIRTTDGTLVVFSTPTLLRQQLEEIKIGESVAIVLAGFEKSNKASPMKVFQVFRLPSGGQRK